MFGMRCISWDKYREENYAPFVLDANRHFCTTLEGLRLEQHLFHSYMSPPNPVIDMPSLAKVYPSVSPGGHSMPSTADLDKPFDPESPEAQKIEGEIDDMIERANRKTWDEISGPARSKPGAEEEIERNKNELLSKMWHGVDPDELDLGMGC